MQSTRATCILLRNAISVSNETCIKCRKSFQSLPVNAYIDRISLLISRMDLRIARINLTKFYRAQR